MCVQLYTSRVILASLGVVDFGLYGVVGGVVGVFSTLVGALGAATSRFFTVELGRNDSGRLRKVFSASVAIHLVMALGVILVCESAGLWFLNTQMEIPAGRMHAARWVFQFSIITAGLSMTQVPYSAAIIAHEEMSVYAYAGLLEAFGRLATACLMAFSPIDKLIWYGLLLMSLQMLVVCIYRSYCLSHYEETRFELPHDKALYRNMLVYSGYDMVGNISVMAQGQGLNMVLNVFCGPVVNAARGIAYQVQGAVTQFSNNFLTAVRPQIIKLYARNEVGAMMRLVYRSSIFTYSLMLMMVLPLSLEVHLVLSLWLGVYPEHADTFTVIVLFNTLLNAFRTPRSTVFHATGHIRLSNMVTGTILSLALPLGYFLMKSGFRPDAVFWGMLGTTALSDLTNLLILKRYVRYSVLDFLKRVHLKCCLMTLTVLSAVLPFRLGLSDGFFRLFACIFMSVATTAAFFWIVVLDRCQRRMIACAVKRRVHGRL